ncbi:gamma-aminobutyric acid type B receptor subunit 2-like [Ruditapes philippinarum]|uniref:gamma-aminobutyric acid type B receptor subunit 2-like n=1 Tax=Ruditapes philippinarum TaxID=129788 RepID=UPI00295B6998|nr:gamma-aminobutyric acid type B receptor subunit 2-like [Ruditapes philippinarum]
MSLVKLCKDIDLCHYQHLPGVRFTVPLCYHVIRIVQGCEYGFGFQSISLGKKKPLYIGVLLELSESWYAKYTNFFPIMFDDAFKRIYNRSDILEGYEFKMIIRDTKGKAGLAARRLTEMIEEDPPKVAIIGPTLSYSLTVTGQIAPFYNIIELSYIAITATTVDRDLFSTLFKVNQVTDAFNPLRIKVMKYFGWTRVGTMVYQEEVSFSQIANFHNLLRDNNMTLVTSAVMSYTSNFKDILKSFKQFGVRIIIGAFRTEVAPYIFCEAYHQKMYGHSHVWILTGPTMFKGWIDNANFDKIGCTKEQLIKATQGYFTTDYQRDGDSTKTTVSGQTWEQAVNDIKVLASSTNFSLSSSLTWIYDTPWALALGLNNSIKYLEASGLELHNYNYSDKYLQAVVRGMKEVKFQGISGPVAFDKTGGRIGVTSLKQHFYEGERRVAWYDPSSDVLTWLMDSNSLWEGSEIPLDRFTYQDVLVKPCLTSFGFVVALNCLGFILSFIFLIFNIYYRRNRMKFCVYSHFFFFLRAIKMSSPMVNNVIIVGCLLIYLEILVKGIAFYRNQIDGIGNSFCTIQIWLLSIGFTLLFGAIFSKTYRVYVVFRDHNMKPIKDYHVFGMIGIMLVIDVIILVPWTIFFPLQLIKVTRLTMNKNDFSSNMIYSETYLQCYHDNSMYWLMVMYIYKGLLLAFGVFIAWETRHVTIPMLNDSKNIGACIYNVVVACIFGVPLAHMLPIEQMTLAFTLESCLLFFCTTSTQCIIFLPKIKVRNQVHGNFVRQQQTLNTATCSTSKTNVVNTEMKAPDHDDNSQDVGLKKENTRLRMIVANEAIAVARLRKQLLQVTGNVHFYKSGDDYVVCRSEGLMRRQSLDDDIADDNTSRTDENTSRAYDNIS